jgi:hypothetical protein
MTVMEVLGFGAEVLLVLKWATGKSIVVVVVVEESAKKEQRLADYSCETSIKV